MILFFYEIANVINKINILYVCLYLRDICFFFYFYAKKSYIFLIVWLNVGY